MVITIWQDQITRSLCESITTRIETCHLLLSPCKSGSSSLCESITTRIETHICFLLYYLAMMVLYVNPLQQGLKHKLFGMGTIE